MSTKDLVQFNDGKQPRHPHWFAIVQNTEAGRKWIENFRKKNPKFKVVCRGRHSDRNYILKNIRHEPRPKYHRNVEVRLHEAERIAVYATRIPIKDKSIKPYDILPDFKRDIIGFHDVRVVNVTNNICTAIAYKYRNNPYTHLGQTYIDYKWSKSKLKWEVSKIY